MAPKLNAAERREMATKAYGLAARSYNYTEIGKQLGITRQTASKLVKEERERVSSEREGQEREEAIEAYLAIIRYGWALLESDELKANSLNQSGVMNSIISARAKIDAIDGVLAPTRSEEKITIDYRDYTTGSELEELFEEIDGWLAEEDREADSEVSLDTE